MLVPRTHAEQLLFYIYNKMLSELFFVTDTYVLYKWIIITKAAILVTEEFIMTIMNSCFTDEHLLELKRFRNIFLGSTKYNSV